MEVHYNEVLLHIYIYIFRSCLVCCDLNENLIMDVLSVFKIKYFV